MGIDEVERKIKKLEKEVGSNPQKVERENKNASSNRKEKLKTIAQLVSEARAELNEYRTEAVRAGLVQHNVHLAQAGQNVYNAWQLYLEVAFQEEIEGENAPQEIEQKSDKLGASALHDKVSNLHLYQYEFNRKPKAVAEDIGESVQEIGEYLAGKKGKKSSNQNPSPIEKDTTFGKGLQTGVIKTKEEKKDAANIEDLI